METKTELQTTEMELQTTETTIDIGLHHHKVKSIEDLKIEEEEGVLCSVCTEVLSGRGFKCTVCNFLCHESCGLLKRGITHPLHPDKFLRLLPVLHYASCHACGKCYRKGYTYKCDGCNFQLDTKCASRWRANKEVCDPHVFVPLVRQIKFTCDFCGEEDSRNGCVCSVCLLTIHAECASFSRTIKIADHVHSLTFTYYAHEVKKQEEQDVEEQEVKEQKKQHVEEHEVEEKEEQDVKGQKEQDVEEQKEQHLEEQEVEEQKEQHVEEHEVEEKEEQDEKGRKEQEVEEQEVKEQKEQHVEDHEVDKEEEQDVKGQKEQDVVEQKGQADIVCKLCSEKVNTNYASYCCRQCSYVAHLRCGRDRAVMEEKDEIMRLVPIKFGGSLTRIIKDMNQTIDKKELAGTINHFSHPHELTLNSDEVTDDNVCELTLNSDEVTDKVCAGCMQLILGPYYSCTRCNFLLHSLCATLPANSTYGGFQFNYTLLARDGVFRCDDCKRHRHGFFYHSEELNRVSDLQCFINQGKLMHKSHGGPLFYHGHSPRKCDSCQNRVHFSCIGCGFSLCYRCATLPIEVCCKFHNHHLHLTKNIEDDSGEYYCLICEKERDSKYWFYYCAKCDFTAHIECIVTKYSYIKFEKTYKDEHHQHPLTFVQKTVISAPCDACGYEFRGVALHCKDCKFNVHASFDGWNKNCLEELDQRLKEELNGLSNSD